MRKAISALVLTAALATTGCSMFRGRQSPDEFAVARNAPLIIPPDFNLAPPVAGTSGLTPSDAQQQAIDVLFGLSYGLISGYFGGKVDMIMQRIVEIINGIPSLVVVTLLMLVMKPGFLTISAALMITGWIGMSRIARAQMLKIKAQEYVLASKTLGAKDAFVIFREVLPNVMGQIIITSMFSIPRAIFTEAFLSFVGLGIPAPMASLGSLISDAFKSLTAHPYMILPPVIVLALLMLSFNMLADGLRDAFEPKMKEM
jgi:oligopeptide transport system permease protein